MPYPRDYRPSKHRDDEHLAWQKDMQDDYERKEALGLNQLRPPARAVTSTARAFKEGREYVEKLLAACTIAPITIVDVMETEGEASVASFVDGTVGATRLEIKVFVLRTWGTWGEESGGRLQVSVAFGRLTQGVEADLTLNVDADYELLSALLKVSCVYDRPEVTDGL